MKKRVFSAIVAMVAICGVQTAMAWENFGHAVIAYSAEQLLKPEVREKCHHYLHSTLAFQASWMDQYRSIPPFTECDKWHSTNIDAKYKVVVGKPGTAAYQIERIRKELKNYKNMSDSLVKLELRYLIHMVGDAHCPVHVRWGKQDHPQFHYSLKNKGKKQSYHGFWDGSLKRWRKNWTAERYFENMELLSPSKRKAVMKGDAYKWTQETADVARYCFTVLPKDTDVATVPQEVREEIHRISDKQAQRAAYRLAGLLNEIFEE